MRLLDSAVVATMTHPPDHAIPLALVIDGTKYHKLAFGQSGHPHGPPDPWLTTRCAIVALEAAATEHDKANVGTFVEQFCTP